MAVIVGMKPADISDFTPTELPIDEMAKGLIATQKRADEVKNTIALGDSALAIETRPFELDIKTAEQIQNDYKNDVNKLIIDAGGDFAKIDNSQIQSLATKYATDERVRMLTSAKKEFDVANSLARKIRETNGSELFFGTVDPRKEGLYDENGNWLNFSSWDMQSELDAIGTAQGLFKNLGTELKSVYGYNEDKDGNWENYYKNQLMLTNEEKNIERIKKIEENGINLFDATPAGKQFRKRKFQEIKNLNPNYSDQEVKTIVDQHIRDLIFSIGDSMEIYKLSSRPVQLSNNTSPTYAKDPKGKKTETDNKTEMVPYNITSIESGKTSYGGLLDNKSLLEFTNDMKNENPIVSNLPELIKNPSSVSNKTVYKQVILGVSPSNMTQVEQGDKIFYQGLLQQLDNGAGRTGDNNRSIFRIINNRNENRDKQSTDLSTYQNDSAIIDLNDFAEAYSQVYAVGVETAKNNLLGTSTVDGIASVFDVNFNTKTKSHELTINPVLTQVVNNLTNKVKNNPKDELSKYKLQKIQQKINEATSYQKDHENDLKKYVNHFDKIDNKIKVFDEIVKTTMLTAGLSQDQIVELNKIHKTKGFSTPYLTYANSIYGDAKLESLDEYIENNKNKFFQYETVKNRYYPGPKMVLSQLGMYQTKDFAAGEYSVNYKRINAAKEIIDKDSSLKKAWTFYNDFLSDVLQNDLDIADVKTTIGKEEYKKIVSQYWFGAQTGTANVRESKAVFEKYAEIKLKKILPDTKNKSYENERKVIINAIASAGSIIKQDNTNFNKFNYSSTDSPLEVEKRIYDKTSELVIERSKKAGSEISQSIVNFFDLSSKYSKDYDESYVLYMPTSYNTPKGNDIRDRMGAQIETSLLENDPTRLKFNRDPEKGQQKLEEKFNRQVVEDYIKKVSGLDEDGKIAPDARQKFYRSAFKGLLFDPDNEKHPYSAVLQLDNFNGVAIRLQVPVTPSPADLIDFGINVMKGKYQNDAMKSLKQYGNSYLELDYENKIKTTAFKAQYDIPAYNIKKGEYYTQEEYGEDVTYRPGALLPAPKGTKLTKPKRLGSLDDVIDVHLKSIYGKLDMDNIQVIQGIYSDINLKDSKIANNILIKKYGFPENYSYSQNLEILKTMNDKVKLRDNTSENINQEQQPEEIQEEEMGK